MEAIGKILEILALLEREWSTTEGRTVEYYNGEIERLRVLTDQTA
ncbi:hypothetical protein [Paenibacillus sp. FSL R7-0273]|nr:hypothetical protein [Paenibacillus sp. FSL R7-0273]